MSSQKPNRFAYLEANTASNYAHILFQKFGPTSLAAVFLARERPPSIPLRPSESANFVDPDESVLVKGNCPAEDQIQRL